MKKNIIRVKFSFNTQKSFIQPFVFFEDIYSFRSSYNIYEKEQSTKNRSFLIDHWIHMEMGSFSKLTKKDLFVTSDCHQLTEYLEKPKADNLCKRMS